MNKSSLPRISMDASPSGLKFRAPPSAVARWDKSIKLAAKPAANEIAILGFIGDLGNTTVDLRRQLKQIGRGNVRLILSSPGGDAIQGIEMFNELREHPGNITVVVRGIAASAASVIAMAGDRIEMGEASLMMIHGAAGMLMGNADDAAKFADLLNKIDNEVAQLYARRTGQPVATILKMMRAETFLTAKEAVEKGFADVAIAEPPSDKKQPSASMRSSLPALATSALLAASGNQQLSSVRMSAHLPGVSGNSKGTTMKTLPEQLAELREQQKVKMLRLGEINQSFQTDANAVTVEMRTEFDTLDVELNALDDQIRTKSFELRMAQSAQPVLQRSGGGQPLRGAPYLNLKAVDQEEKFKGQNWTRQVIAMALAHNFHMNPVEVARMRWGNTNPTLCKIIEMRQNLAIRMAAVPGAGSDSGEWGSELVTADTRYTGDFIEYLYAMTVFDQLALREVPANVQVKGTDGAATAYWVGQSKAIPTTQGSASAVNLTPLKVAALAVVSNELLADSTPAAEQWIRDLLAEAMSQRVDQTFLSATAAQAGVSPAGILNGVSAKTSAGTSADNIRTDIEVLMGDFIAARNLRDLTFVTSTGLGLSIQLMRNALGQREFDGVKLTGGQLEGLGLVTGDNVGSGDFILLSPKDIWKIGDTGIQVAISKDATVEQQDNPTGATDTPVGMTTTNATNMFQEDSTAIRLIRRINFQKRRAGAVAYVGDAGYGGVAS